MREHGPAAWPLNAAAVNSIAEEIRRQRGGPLDAIADEAELTDMLAAADAAIERLDQTGEG